MQLDLTAGCKIEFTENVYGGSYRKPTFLGERQIVGTIVQESYGDRRGQHTFTIDVISATGYDASKVLDQTKILRKGRNVYKNCLLLETPDDYETLRINKHFRGIDAKELRV